MLSENRFFSRGTRHSIIASAFLAAGGITVLALASCSKSTPPSSGADTGYVATRAITDPPQPPPKQLRQPDRSTPLSQYREVNDDEQLMALFYALSALPIDYDKAAEIISKDYAQERDAFKRHEMMAVLKPRIDAEVSAARENPYIKLELDSLGLGPYDFDRKGFPNDSFARPDHYYNFRSDYSLRFSNVVDYKLLKVTDEGAARAIETARTTGMGLMKPTFYAYAQDVDLSKRQVLAVIVRISLTDANDKPLYLSE